MPASRLSKLEAVNQVLRGVGERPVNTLDGQTSQNARIAEQIFDQVCRELQSEPWWFNSEECVTLSSDSSTGMVTVPDDVTRFKPIDEPYIVQRGSVLYDKQARTDILNRAVTGNLVRVLDFDLLPEEAKYHMAAKAARMMMEQFLQAPLTDGIRLNELSTRAALMDRELELGNYNMQDARDMPVHTGSRIVPGSGYNPRH